MLDMEIACNPAQYKNSLFVVYLEICAATKSLFQQSAIDL